MFHSRRPDRDPRCTEIALFDSGGSTPSQATAIANLIAALGTSSNVLGFYDTSQNATTTSWGPVSGITSPRGNLTTSSITGLSAPTLAGGLYSFNGTSQGLCSTTTGGNCETPQTIVVIGALASGTGNNIVCLTANLDAGQSIGTNSGAGFWEGRVITTSGSAWGSTGVAVGSSVYVASMAVNGNETGTVWLSGTSSVPVTGAAAQGAIGASLSVGCASSAGAATGYTACTVATVIVLAEVITTVHLGDIFAYGQTYVPGTVAG